MLISPNNLFVLSSEKETPNDNIVVYCSSGAFGDLPTVILFNKVYYKFECNRGTSDKNGNYFDYKLIKTPSKEELEECLKWEEANKYERNLSFDKQIVSLHRQIDNLTNDRLAVKSKQMQVNQSIESNINAIKQLIGIENKSNETKGENHLFGGCQTRSN